jgi:dolichol-phosphate mannosyltransferase
MSNYLISIVIPVYNEHDMVVQTYTRTKKALQNIHYELVFVDDGSTDESRQKLFELAAGDPAVKVVALSRNFGHQSAVTAGLVHAEGDAVVVMDADLQDPPELIELFIELWKQGYDVVYGIRHLRIGDSWFKRKAAHLFYRTLGSLSDVNIPPDVGDFRLMSRRVVDVVNAMPEYHRYLRGMVAWAGFRQIGVPYNRAPRSQGTTHYSWKKMWHLSLDGITSFSIQPLRWIRRVALMVSALALMASLWLIYQKLSNPKNPALVLGWTSMMVTVLWLGSLQLGVLGIIGEYVGRTLEQGRQRPQFIVDQVVSRDLPKGIHDNTTSLYQQKG